MAGESGEILDRSRARAMANQPYGQMATTQVAFHAAVHDIPVHLERPDAAVASPIHCYTKTLGTGRVDITEERVKERKHILCGPLNNEGFDNKRMTNMSHQDGHSAVLRRGPSWSGRPLTEVVDRGFVRTLNERCIDLMVDLARSDRAPTPPAVSANRSLWCSLEQPARERAASHPVLLLDINFTDPAWWRWVTESRSTERELSAVSYLSLEIASGLMRETLTLAWVIARQDSGMATIFCGMAPSVARIISSFSPLDVEHISGQYHRHLRLRFDDCPAYWRMHLSASRTCAVLNASGLQAPADSLQQSLQ